ncbi:hypothetical protein CTAYLR_004870 [Chrysophaeum taylorii]|uniref:CBS domain-containing protein n=1 Tax=Chrysophaeum taylorii TaxID=2483200 RepID=A0AAD7UFP3_9STRA|nr:hypothetical protein CTAYLR_004870 [Chrysophaeum taylorii]
MSRLLSRLAGWLAANETMASVLETKRGGLKGRDLKRYLKSQEPIWTIETAAFVADALEKIVTNRIGALIVTETSTIAGIVTDRDLLKFMRATHNARYPLATTPVTQIMTPSERVVCVGPEDTRQQAIDIMKARNIRHLPVVEGDSPRRLIGIVSVADLLHTAPSPQTAKFSAELHPEGLMFIGKRSPERKRVITKWTR